MVSRVLLFAVVLAGAAVWWARAAGEIASNLGSWSRLEASLAAGAGREAGGDPALARVAEQLRRTPDRGGRALVFGGDRNEATWIAYFAYPRLVRDVSTVRAEATLERLAPGGCTLIGIPSPGGSDAAAARFGDTFGGLLRTRYGFASAEIAYRDPSGIVIVEAVR